MDKYVYKLFLKPEWEAFCQSELFNGTPLDIKDGYIHLSAHMQVQETARLHFKNKGDLVLGQIMRDDLGAALKYEPARDGSLFPHYYGQLKKAQIKRYWPLSPGPTGLYEFPTIFSQTPYESDNK